MTENLNLNVFNFNKQLSQLLIKYGQGIPISSLYLIIKDQFKDIEQAYMEYISLAQLQQQTKQLEEKNDKEKTQD